MVKKVCIKILAHLSEVVPVRLLCSPVRLNPKSDAINKGLAKNKLSQIICRFVGAQSLAPLDGMFF